MAKWTPAHEAPEPLEGPVVATVTGGTIIWFVLFLVQLPFYGWFDDHGHLWWLWTCAAGGALGLVGGLVRTGARRGTQARGGPGGDRRGAGRHVRLRVERSA